MSQTLRPQPRLRSRCSSGADTQLSMGHLACSCPGQHTETDLGAAGAAAEEAGERRDRAGQAEPRAADTGPVEQHLPGAPARLACREAACLLAVVSVLDVAACRSMTSSTQCVHRCGNQQSPEPARHAAGWAGRQAAQHQQHQGEDPAAQGRGRQALTRAILLSRSQQGCVVVALNPGARSWSALCPVTVQCL